jgi:hypothetical protein
MHQPRNALSYRAKEEIIMGGYDTFNPLTDNEYKLIFEAVWKGDTLHELRRSKEFKREVGHRDKNTIARAFNVVQLLHDRPDRFRPLTAEEAEAIKKRARYNTTAHYVQDVFRRYKFFSEQQT